MAQTVTITYSVAGFSGSNTAAVVVAVPGTIDATRHVANIYLSGGAWIPGPTGNQVFVPASQIISISTP
jgi:hypothetical protein